MDKDDYVKVSLKSGETFHTKNCFVFCGAQNKEIFESATMRAGNESLELPELEQTFITAISTVRYQHANSIRNNGTALTTPIILGQIEVPQILNFQANFSIVPEDFGNILKTRLSGAEGSEVIPYVSSLHDVFQPDDDAAMAIQYKQFFGSLFPFLCTEQPLDFNRCVTYRNHGKAFSGTSALLEKRVGGDARVLTTAGCFGVGVKYGPLLGEAVADHVFQDGVRDGINVLTSGVAGLTAARGATTEGMLPRVTLRDWRKSATG